MSVNNAPIIISCNEYFIIQCCDRTHLNMFKEKDDVELERKATEKYKKQMKANEKKRQREKKQTQKESIHA